MAVVKKVLNTYSLTKKRFRDTLIIGFFTIPAAYTIAKALGAFMDGNVLLEMLFALVVILTLLVGLYVIIRLTMLATSADLVCEKCRAPAFSKNLLSSEWKIQGFYRGFKDICPNCGNDNRIDLHDS